MMTLLGSVRATAGASALVMARTVARSLLVWVIRHRSWSVRWLLLTAALVAFAPGIRVGVAPAWLAAAAL